MTTYFKNRYMTVGHPDCRLCNYAGHSSRCVLQETGNCPCADFIKALRRKSGANGRIAQQ